MGKEQLVENLLEIGVSGHQIDKFLKEYTVDKLAEYFDVINFKKNVLKEKGIRNWAAFYVKQVKDHIDISIIKREMQTYYHKQQQKAEQKTNSNEESNKKKKEHEQYLADYKRMTELCQQLTETELNLMKERIDQYIEKEHGPVKFGIETLRSINIIKTFKTYNWDIELIKKRLS